MFERENLLYFNSMRIYLHYILATKKPKKLGPQHPGSVPSPSRKVV